MAAAKRTESERAAGADAEATEAVAQSDPRMEYLRKMQEGVDAEWQYDSKMNPKIEGDPIPAGGDVKVVVLLDKYHVKVDDVYQTFERGNVLLVSEAVAKRGVKFDGLKRL